MLLNIPSLYVVKTKLVHKKFIFSIYRTLLVSF